MKKQRAARSGRADRASAAVCLLLAPLLASSLSAHAAAQSAGAAAHQEDPASALGPVAVEAVRHHRRAQALRQEGVREQDEGRLAEARAAYGRAVEGYRIALGGGLAPATACDLRYNLADALYWSGRYAEAEPEYARLRDRCAGSVSPSATARRVVESLHRQLEEAERAGGARVRDEAPAPSGAPPSVAALPMPPLVFRLFEARERYLAQVDEAHDEERVRDAYALNNATLLYLYGRWVEARRRLHRIYRARCHGPGAAEVGRPAWELLYEMAGALRRPDRREALSRDLVDRRCAFEEPDPGVMR